MPNLVCVTSSSLKILPKTQTGVYSIFGILVNHLFIVNSRNSRTSDGTDVKLRALTKPEKRDKIKSKKKFMMTSRKQIVT